MCVIRGIISSDCLISIRISNYLIKFNYLQKCYKCKFNVIKLMKYM